MHSPENIDKELAALRKEWQALERQNSRIIWVRLVLLVIVALTFLDGFNQMSSGELAQLHQQIADKMKVLCDQHKAQAFIYDPFQEPHVFCRIKEGILAFDQQQLGDVWPLVKKYQPAYRKAFVRKLQFWSIEEEFDILHWLYLLPIGVAFSEIYLFINRKKQKMLKRIGAHNLQGNSQAPILSRLLFEHKDGTPAYEKHPSQMIHILQVAAGLGLLCYIFISTYGFGYTDLALAAVLPLIYYCVAYTWYVSRRLEAQLTAEADLNTTPVWISSAWNFIKKAFAWISRKARSRKWLSVSSVINLASLGLIVSETGCGHSNLGYEIFLGRAEWGGTDLLEPQLRLILRIATQSVYVFGILIAVLTLVLVITSKFRPAALFPHRLMLWPSRIAGTVALYLLFDLGMGDLLNLVAPIPWALTALTWYIGTASKKKNLWIWWRSFFIVLYLPLGYAIVGSMFFTGFRLLGLKLFSLGIFALALSYLQLEKLHNTETDKKELAAAAVFGASP